MSRRIKEIVETSLNKRYTGLDSAIVVSVHGLTGVEVNNFRTELRKHKVEVHVVKNRAMKRILSGTPLEGITGSLSGPCAFVTGGDSPVDTAKELLRLVKEYPKLELRFGVVDGERDTLTVEEISKRKSRAELQGELVMIAISPGRKIAGCLNMGGKIAGCIKAIVDKLEKGEAITRVA